MRIDRKLTTAVFHPLQRAGIPGAGFRLPILMFHSISDDPENGVAPYFKTNTAPVSSVGKCGSLPAKVTRPWT